MACENLVEDGLEVEEMYIVRIIKSKITLITLIVIYMFPFDFNRFVTLLPYCTGISCKCPRVHVFISKFWMHIPQSDVKSFRVLTFGANTHSIVHVMEELD